VPRGRRFVLPREDRHDTCPALDVVGIGDGRKENSRPKSHENAANDPNLGADFRRNSGRSELCAWQDGGGVGNQTWPREGQEGWVFSMTKRNILVGAIFASLAVTGLSFAQAAFSKAQVAERIRKVEDGVDEFRK
jgi:hypothetical protein